MCCYFIERCRRKVEQINSDWLDENAEREKRACQVQRSGAEEEEEEEDAFIYVQWVDVDFTVVFLNIYIFFICIT